MLVLRNCGPKGYSGMAEVGNMGLPPKLLRRGVTDMARVSDARMSSTACGTVVLHVAPEAAAGGPLAAAAGARAVMRGPFLSGASAYPEILDRDGWLRFLDLCAACRFTVLRLDRAKLPHPRDRASEPPVPPRPPSAPTRLTVCKAQ